jgi:hypothetical protein
MIGRPLAHALTGSQQHKGGPHNLPQGGRRIAYAGADEVCKATESHGNRSPEGPARTVAAAKNSDAASINAIKAAEENVHGSSYRCCKATEEPRCRGAPAIAAFSAHAAHHRHVRLADRAFPLLRDRRPFGYRAARYPHVQGCFVSAPTAPSQGRACPACQ